VARTSTAANVVGRVVFFPLMFFAGLWLPRALMPPVLLDISNYTPLGAAVQAMQPSVQTGFPPAAPLLVLAAYAVVFGYLARRFFRWEYPPPPLALVLARGRQAVGGGGGLLVGAGQFGPAAVA